MAVAPIPQGSPRISPYLVVPGVDRLIVFLSDAFDATLVMRHDTPEGNVMHAEVRVGDSVIMMGEAGAEWTPIPAALHLYVEDVDATHARAVAAGAASLAAPADQFYGNRMAHLQDPSGNTWFLATRIEEVPEDELARRLRIEMERRAKQNAG